MNAKIRPEVRPEMKRVIRKNLSIFKHRLDHQSYANTRKELRRITTNDADVRAGMRFMLLCVGVGE